jgi:hypothetical protein
MVCNIFQDKAIKYYSQKIGLKLIKEFINLTIDINSIKAPSMVTAQKLCNLDL